MKKIYETPKVLLAIFETEDLVTLSIPDFVPDGIEDFGDTGGIE